MEDQDFRFFCNMLDGLAFLPIADLPEGIAYIRSVITEEPAETEELVDYIETTYVTGTYRPVQRNGEQRLTMRRVPPMFPPSIWSVHSATVDSDPRTNNVDEGWNNKFFTLVGSAHPSIWTCNSVYLFCPCCFYCLFLYNLCITMFFTYDFLDYHFGLLLPYSFADVLL